MQNVIKKCYNSILIKVKNVIIILYNKNVSLSLHIFGPYFTVTRVRTFVIFSGTYQKLQNFLKKKRCRPFLYPPFSIYYIPKILKRATNFIEISLTTQRKKKFTIVSRDCGRITPRKKGKTRLACQLISRQTFYPNRP